MGRPVRDHNYHTYGDYLTWVENDRYELIDGIAEFWLVHPNDRVVTVYRLADGEYGKPEVQELIGETRVGVLPGVSIAWDELTGRLSPILP